MSDQRQRQVQELALRERVKELACLYGIAQLVTEQELPLESLLRRVVELLPPAWQYPEVARARITVDGRHYDSAASVDGVSRQSADIVVAGTPRGRAEVVYTEDRPAADEGPFLREERHLIDAVARQVALIIQRREAERDKVRLQAQLRHADRLATIGVLAAGVAHELNEPLGNILGFAQLMKKAKGLAPQAAADLAKIEAASLQAREIIRKLLIFARPVPAEPRRMNLNQVIEEGLELFKARCAQENVQLETDLSPALPSIIGNAVQLSQVLVNLVVNALQAMPGGGRLTVRTRPVGDQALWTVEDTGVGMAPEVLEKIFLPFFTTKDVGQGTGLGLSVVHGIVTAHGGTIRADSRAGRGARFEILLPLARPRGRKKDR